MLPPSRVKSGSTPYTCIPHHQVDEGIRGGGQDETCSPQQTTYDGHPSNKHEARTLRVAVRPATKLVLSKSATQAGAPWPTVN